MRLLILEALVLTLVVVNCRVLDYSNRLRPFGGGELFEDSENKKNMENGTSFSEGCELRLSYVSLNDFQRHPRPGMQGNTEGIGTYTRITSLPLNVLRYFPARQAAF